MTDFIEKTIKVRVHRGNHAYSESELYENRTVKVSPDALSNLYSIKALVDRAKTGMGKGLLIDSMVSASDNVGSISKVLYGVSRAKRKADADPYDLTREAFGLEVKEEPKDTNG